MLDYMQYVLRNGHQFVANEATLDDCYGRAQIPGTIPSLCFPDSSFKKCFKACVECAVTAPEDKKPSLNDVFEVFEQFTDYCSRLGIIGPYPQSMLTTATRAQIFVLTEFGDTVGHPQPVVATVIEVRPELLSPQATSTSTSQSTVSNGSVGGSGALKKILSSCFDESVPRLTASRMNRIDTI